jgi:hypothetical protein
MDFMMLVAFMGATAVCVIALVAIALAFWQGAGADKPVLLYPMLRRQSEEAAASPSAPEAAALPSR